MPGKDRMIFRPSADTDALSTIAGVMDDRVSHGAATTWNLDCALVYVSMRVKLHRRRDKKTR
jgi:hypothetical protein